MKSLKAVFGALLVGGITLASPAHAHSVLRSSIPVANTAVTPPKTVELRFSEKIGLKFSAITLTSPSGSAVPTSPLSLGADGRSLVTALPDPLPPGKYRVTWAVLSRDGHKASGNYSFTVRPAQ